MEAEGISKVWTTKDLMSAEPARTTAMTMMLDSRRRQRLGTAGVGAESTRRVPVALATDWRGGKVGGRGSGVSWPSPPPARGSSSSGSSWEVPRTMIGWR